MAARGAGCNLFNTPSVAAIVASTPSTRYDRTSRSAHCIGGRRSQTATENVDAPFGDRVGVLAIAAKT